MHSRALLDALRGLLICAALAVPAANAQRLTLLRPEDYFVPERYLDPAAVSAAEALDFLQRSDFSRYGPIVLLHRVGASGDPAYREPLKRLAERYRQRERTSGRDNWLYNALYALRSLGEPESYFLWHALDAGRNPVFAGAALDVLAQDPDSATYTLLHPLQDRVVQRDVTRGMGHYGLGIFSVRRQAQMASPLEKARDLIRNARGAGATIYDLYTGGSPLAVWARSRLRALYREHPAAVEAAIAEVAPDPERLRRDPREAERIAERSRRLLTDVIHAPETVVREAFAPPAQARLAPGAEIVPLLECVAENDDGSLTAFFGYDNRAGSPVSIPTGPSNHVEPLAYDGRQPERFDLPRLGGLAPGRTPPFPGYAFHVRFPPAERVVWTLAGRSVTASSASPRCPR